MGAQSSGEHARGASADTSRAESDARVSRPAGCSSGAGELGAGRVSSPFPSRTAQSQTALLWIHGGGLVIGTAQQDSASCADIAASLGIVVVAADYRIAPEHRFPTPLDDCHRVWSWIVDHADRLGVDPERIAVGGQSAGGGLAAALTQRLYNEAGTLPVAQWLFCPMLDDRTAADRRLDAVRHFLWNNRSNRAGWQAYLGRRPGAAELAPYASPARATDLRGLPPTWIGCGDIELFFREDRAYVTALAEAGVDCTLDVVPGAPHAFETICVRTQLARDYTARARRWLTRQPADKG